MSLLLISQAYSFSDEDENAAASTPKENNSECLKGSRGDVEFTVNLKRRTSLPLAKPFKTANLKETAQNRKYVKISRKSLENDETKDENGVFTSSFLDLLDPMETKTTLKRAELKNVANRKMPSAGKLNRSEYNRPTSSPQEVLLKRQRKFLASNQCIFCFKHFGHFAYLRRHILGHVGEKPFNCNVCNESYARLSILKIHQLTHDGENPNKCRICDKSFTRSDGLKKHERVHTGEKPFQCQVCSVKFSHKSTLTSHGRIHTGERPFQCTMCSKRFANSNNLKRHERIHTEAKRFECPSCDKTFSRLDSLKRHAQQHKNNHD